MAKAEPRWIDTPAFQWSPDRPFHAEPGFNTAPPKKAAANDDADPAPRRGIFHAAIIGILSIRTPGYFLTRLTIGLLQGFGFLALTAAHADNGFSAALSMVLLFAPLILLAGLDRVPGKLLLPWTLIAGVALAALGLYQHWRAPGASTLTTIALAAIFLFVAQAMIAAWARRNSPWADYPAYHDSAWNLAMQCLLGAVTAIAGYVLAGDGLALLRQHYPGAHPNFLLVPIVTLSIAAMSWLAFPSLLRLLWRGVQALLGFALPLVVLLAASAGVAGVLLHWQPPLQLCLGLGVLLLLCLNASYRDGGERPRWNQIAEFCAAFGLVPPVLLGAWALYARVTQAGWTDTRILAAAALVVLGAYALFYIVAALIGLGGGGPMKRIERVNLAMAVVALGLVAALLSPLADPMRLAVTSQLQRLSTGKVAVDAFDYAWLNSDGGRFGHQALEQMMARRESAEQSRGAFLALIAQPDTARPAPSEIGANIEVRSEGQRLPAALLTRDWSQVKTPGVPPCLTTAILPCDAYFVDLDGDGQNEIVLVYGNNGAWWAAVMKPDARGQWAVAGTLSAPSCGGSLDALRAGRFAPVAPLPSGWQDLLVGGARLSVAPSNPAKAGCS